MSKIYQCNDCGLHYDKEQTTDECYAFCVKYKACSLEITKKSVEYQENEKETK